MTHPINDEGAALPVLTVALSGGIASGKSAAAERFAQLGVPVFDADVVARDVVAPAQPALAEIVATFGAEFANASGELDRARMRALVFADSGARKQLEAILHPRIRRALVDSVRSCASSYCILAIPLLVESYADYRWVDRILITDVPAPVQLARLTRRPGIDPALAARILSAQASREQRLALADDVIDNTAPLESLGAVAARLHQRYLGLAAQRQQP